MNPMNLFLAILICANSVFANQSETIGDLYKRDELVVNLSKAANTSEIGSLSGLIRALDTMTSEQRAQYFENTKNNIATIQKSIADEIPKLEAAKKAIKQNGLLYATYQVTGNELLYIIGGVSGAIAGIISLVDSSAPKALKVFFVADVLVLVSAGLIQSYGFKTLKLKEAEIEKLQASLRGLQILLSRESEVLKLMEVRYSQVKLNF
ncbi:MAG: hypothetical protein ACK5V3_00930 [Bdellovibrionales bacterium]